MAAFEPQRRLSVELFEARVVELQAGTAEERPRLSERDNADYSLVAAAAEDSQQAAEAYTQPALAGDKREEYSFF